MISNTDDHLRNHGFLLHPGKGWRLAPTYDMNPVCSGQGLHLNIVGSDNALDLDLTREAAAIYRVKKARREEIITEVKTAVKRWHSLAQRYNINPSEQDRMARAFRVVAT